MNIRALRSNRRERSRSPRRSFFHNHKPRVSRFEPLEPRLVLYNVCSDDGPCTHEAMTAEGLALYSDLRGPNALAQEIRDNASNVFQGVTAPDDFDPFYGNTGVGGGLITIDHFWNPDFDLDAPMEFNLVLADDYPNAFGAAQAAWSRALGEYAAGDKGQAYFFLGMVAHFLGDQSIPTHVHGDTHGPDIIDYDSFEEWMSIKDVGNEPVFVGPRPNVGKSFAYLTQGEHDTLRNRQPGSGLLDPSPFATEINDQLLWIFLNTNQVADFFASDGGGFGMTGSAVNGDANHPSDPDFPFISGWAQDAINRVASGCAAETTGCPTTLDQLVDNHGFGMVPQLIPLPNDVDGDLSLIRKYSYLHGVQAMGALSGRWKQAGSSSIVYVTVERISEVGAGTILGVIGLDDFFGPDYYVGIVSGYNQRLRSNTPVGAYLHNRDGSIRNIDGENMAANVTRIDAFFPPEIGGHLDETEVHPNYRFGQANLYPEGTHAYVPCVDRVNISLAVWDQDSSPISPFVDPYDLDQVADINPEPGRTLNISVDLANCVSRSGVQVTVGSSQHACGVSINKGARDDEASDVEVNFKID